MSLLCFHDVDIYDRDLRLFEDGKWLNDTCINYCFRKMEHEGLHDSNSSTDSIDGSSRIISKRILLMDPCVVSFLRLQCEDEDELQELREGLAIGERDVIFVPINDCDSFESSSTHWSLLIITDATSLRPSIFHADSCGRYNKKAAMATRDSLAQLLQR